MIPGLPSPWILLGTLVAFIGVAIGGYAYGSHVTALSYKAAIAKQDATANSLLAQLTQTAFAKDKAASDFARNLDEQHAHETQAINDAANGAAADYAARLRRLANSRPSCPGPGPAQAINPGGGADVTGGSNDQLAAESGRALAELGKAADTLAAYARSCHDFALSVGR